MPELTVCFDLPDFWYGFSEARASELAKLLEWHISLAEEAGLTLREHLDGLVVEAPRWLAEHEGDPAAQDRAHLAIVAYVLQQPTDSDERPGLFADYIGAYDPRSDFYPVRGWG